MIAVTETNARNEWSCGLHRFHALDQKANDRAANYAPECLESLQSWRAAHARSETAGGAQFWAETFEWAKAERLSLRPED